MTGAGLKKCSPRTRSGRVVAAAIEPTDSALVLVASITSGRLAASSARKIACFRSRSSSAASITTSASAPTASRVCASRSPVSRPATQSSMLSASRSSRAARRARPSRILARPRAIAASSTSCRTTSSPFSSASWAIPAPIVPAPTTPMTDRSTCGMLAQAALKGGLGVRIFDCPLDNREPCANSTSHDISSTVGSEPMNVRIPELGRFAEPALLILVSLSDGPKHGYAIMTDVEAGTGRPLGPGTLYAALARLEERGLDRTSGPGRPAATLPPDRAWARRSWPSSSMTSRSSRSSASSASGGLHGDPPAPSPLSGALAHPLCRGVRADPRGSGTRAFDVADVLLGALDAHLHLRGLAAASATERVLP